MGTAKPKAGACVHENIFSITIAPGHVPVPGPASAANNPGPGSARVAAQAPGAPMVKSR